MICSLKWTRLFKYVRIVKKIHLVSGKNAMVYGGALICQRKKEHTVPLLPLRGLLVYPTMVLHLDVGREHSVQALEQSMMNDHLIFLTTQKDDSINEPNEEDLYRMGTLTKVKQMLKLPNGTIRVLVEGLYRAEIQHFYDENNYYAVSLKTYEQNDTSDVEMIALMRTMLEYFEQYIKLSKKISAETFETVSDIEEPGRMADIIASHLPLKLSQNRKSLKPLILKRV